MKTHSIFALVLLSLFLSANVFATWSPTGVLLSGVEVDISSTATNGTATFLSFSATPGNKPACGSLSQGELTGTPDNVKAITTLATAAFLAGKSVRVNWDGTCDGGYARVSMILVN